MTLCCAGILYHIVRMDLQEPQGEVLDPLKLLTVWFGLCYHLAPLWKPRYEAAGFADATLFGS